MIYLSSALSFSLLLCIAFTSSTDPSIFGNLIYDLRSLTISGLKIEAQRWQAMGLVDANTKIYHCLFPFLGGVDILTDGGYFERTYNNLPSHDIIIFIFRFMLIDKWESKDSFSIYFDDRKFVSDWLFGQYRSLHNFCGLYSLGEIELEVMGKLNHTNSSLTVRIVSKKASMSSGAFGVRYIDFQFTNKSESHEENSCAMSLIPSINSGIYGCGCSTGYYNSSSSNTCEPCSRNCRECFGPSDRECYGCITNGFNGTHCIECSSLCETCIGPTSSDCTSCPSDMWHYWDNTCKLTCLPPLIQETTFNRECKSPCQVNDTFILWDGSCVSSCETPLRPIQKGKAKICEYPCSASQYLFPNGSCITTCPAPWKRNVTLTKDLCNYPCSDQSNFYYRSDGICRATCETPFIQGLTDSGKFCASPCLLATDFLYSNGSCKSQCPTVWSQVSFANVKLCNASCNDSTQYFYTSDQTCYPTCAAPLVTTQRGSPAKLYCSSPCLLATDFLHSNGSCNSQCPAGRSQSLVGNIKICYAYCSDTTQYFYKSDQTCNSTCVAPLVATQTGSPTKLYCSSPCSSTQILNWNGVCLDECKAPFVLRTYAGIQICYAPCEDASRYYFEENKTCQVTCVYPNVTYSRNGARFCKSTASSITVEEMKKVEQIASFSEAGGTAASIGAMITTLLTPGDPGSMGAASLVKMLQYIKLLDIRYPPKLFLSLKQKKIVPTGLTFAPKIFAEVKAAFQKRALPGRFELFELHSSFLVNNWEFIFTLLIVISSIAVISLLKLVFRKCSKVNGIIEKVMPSLKWNFFLTVFCSNSADIALYTATEVISIHLDNFFSILSLLVCIALNAVCLMIIIFIININFSLQHIKKRSHQNNLARKLKSFEKKWEAFTMVFLGFHHTSLLQQVYMFFFVVRAYLTNIIVGFFYSYPLAQGISLTILSFCMLLYVVLKRPMNKTLNNIQQIFLEATILIVNVSILALSIMDYKNVEDPDRRETFGDIVINTSLAISLGSPVFLVLKLILMIREQYLARKAAKLAEEKRKENLEAVQTQTKQIQTVEPVVIYSIKLQKKFELVRPSRLPHDFQFQQTNRDMQKTTSPINGPI